MNSSFVEQLLETAPAAVYLYDLAARRAVLVSGGSFRRLGASTAELEEGDTLRRLMHPDDQPRFDQQMQRLAGAKANEPLEFEYRLRAADGSWRWFRSRDVVFSRGPDGQVAQIVGVATEITAERRVERERDRLVSVIEAAEDFIAMARPDGSVLYVNPAGRQLVGMGADESLEGLYLEDFHPRSEVTRMFETVFPAVSRGRVLRTGTSLRCRDGRIVPVSLVLSAHRGRDGRVAYFSAIMRDLSGEQRGAAELERLDAALAAEASRGAAAAEQALEQKAERARDLGRLLRPPLDALRGCTEALAARCGDTPALEQLEAAVRDLERLTSELMRGAEEPAGARFVSEGDERLP